MKTACNDIWIDQFIKDRNYIVLKDGSILSYITRQGHVSTKLRKVGMYHRGNGYLYVRYFQKHLAVHRIVYRKFIGPLNMKLEVNHKDGNTINNSVDNLELVTASNNQKHKYRVLKAVPSAGNARLNADIVKEIRLMRKAGYSYKDITQRYAISKATVSLIVNNKIWVKKTSRYPGLPTI